MLAWQRKTHKTRNKQPGILYGCRLTGSTQVESTVFPGHFNQITLNQRGIDVELTSVPMWGVYGLMLFRLPPDYSVSQRFIRACEETVTQWT